MSDSEAFKRPNVTKDGKPVNFDIRKEQLSRKTLDVYKFLISNRGFHGVRDLQRMLNYSSPGSVSYHLKRLMKYNLIIRTEDGKYGIFDTTESSDDLANYIHLMLKNIPAYTYFAIILLLTGVFVLVAGFITSTNPILVFISASVLIGVGYLLLRQAVMFAYMLEEINEIVIDMKN